MTLNIALGQISFKLIGLFVVKPLIFLFFNLALFGYTRFPFCSHVFIAHLLPQFIRVPAAACFQRNHRNLKEGIAVL